MVGGKKRLSEMELPPHLLHVLHARNLITARDVLMRTEAELVELLDVAMEVVKAVVAVVCEEAAPQCRTVREMVEERRYLRTSMEGLDRALCGGVPFGVVTEVAGRSGMGKTQLCLMLAVLGVMPAAQGGLDGCVLYVDTERNFRPKRMLQIAQAKFPAAFAGWKEMVREVGSRVLVLQPGSVVELMETLQEVEGLVAQHRVRVLLLDSVAGLVQGEFGMDRIMERQQVLGQAASLLKRLAERFRIPVVVTNQVRMQRAGQGDVPAFQEDGSDMHLSPALGTRWSHAVNIRLVLEECSSLTPARRFLKIVKCPMSPILRFPYTITAAGVEQLTTSP